MLVLTFVENGVRKCSEQISRGANDSRAWAWCWRYKGRVRRRAAGGLEGEANGMPCPFAAISHGKQQSSSIPHISRTGKMEKMCSLSGSSGE